MNNASGLTSLIADRLNAIDRSRERQMKPLRFCYIGERKAGELADYPVYWRNVREIREGDERPAGTVIYAWGWSELIGKFEDMTVKMGPNVWRWK